MDKNYLIGLKWILLISFLVRLVLILNPNSYTTFDEREYYDYGRGLSTDIGRPFFILILSKLSSSLIALRMIDLSFGLLSIFTIYKIGIKLFDEKVGNISALILAFNPLHIMLSSLFLTDVIFLSFYLLFIHFIFQKKFDLSILFAVLAIFTRYEGFLLLIITIFFFFHFKIKNKHELVKMILVFMAVGLMLYPRISMFSQSNIFILNNPIYLYLVTPFLINGFLTTHSIASLRKIFNNKFFFLTFFSFVIFFMATFTGFTLSDKFRYVLPTLPISSLFISNKWKGSNFLIVLAFLNLFSGLFLALYFQEVKSSLLSFGIFGLK